MPNAPKVIQNFEDKIGISISYTDTDGTGDLDDFAVGINEAKLIYSLLDGDGIYVVGLIGNHTSKGFLLS